jgi:hypothetical protein
MGEFSDARHAVHVDAVDELPSRQPTHAHRQDSYTMAPSHELTAKPMYNPCATATDGRKFIA